MEQLILNSSAPRAGGDNSSKNHFFSHQTLELLSSTHSIVEAEDLVVAEAATIITNSTYNTVL